MVWMPQMREAVGAMATATLLLSLTACGGHDSSDASRRHSHSTPPSAPPVTTPTFKPSHYHGVHVDATTRRAAHTTTQSYLAGFNRLLARPTHKRPHQQVIAGPALANLLEMRKEYAGKHYRVVGEPKIVSQKVIKRRAHPPLLVVATCLDNTAVKVLDKHGQQVTTSAGPARVMNLLTLVFRDGHWLVTHSSLPTNPAC